jgi:hypothetical protein
MAGARWKRIAAGLAGLAALALAGCGNPVGWEGNAARPDSLVNYYRTPHFVFFYDTSVYGRAEIEANGKAKEAHLKRIESELGVSFGKEIMVRLISESGENWSGQAYPREPYFIQETRGYFIRDNGHEIVHIVSFETMGFPGFRFFVEGLAAAHELDARPKWARLCGATDDSLELLGKLLSMTQARNSEQVDYALAAAYVEWLEGEFGLEGFKAFYRDLGLYTYSSLASLIERDFGMTEEELHGRFFSERYRQAIGSKYCGD